MDGVMWPVAALFGAGIGFGVCLLLVWRFSRLASDMTCITQRQASLEEVDSLKADLAKLRADRLARNERQKNPNPAGAGMHRIEALLRRAMIAEPRRRGDAPR